MNRFCVATLGPLIFLIQPSHASTIFCGNDLVDLGDHLIEVLAKCGRPAYVEERVIYKVKKIELKAPRVRRDLHAPRDVNARRGVRVQKETHLPISAETWLYNFGPNRLMREVWFVDGRVRKIRSLGYGFTLPDESLDRDRPGLAGLLE